MLKLLEMRTYNKPDIVEYEKFYIVYNKRYRKYLSLKDEYGGHLGGIIGKWDSKIFAEKFSVDDFLTPEILLKYLENNKDALPKFIKKDIVINSFKVRITKKFYVHEETLSAIKPKDNSQ